MEDKRTKQASKFLSLILRHNPGKIGLELDDSGWADVTTMLDKIREYGRGSYVDLDKLHEIVNTNNKRRFEFNEDETKIRARQGHSIQVELGHEAQKPPEFLYHGTATRTLPAIRSGGLLKMSRHAVHLSLDLKTATDVGSRHGSPVVIKVRALQMHDDGHEFFLTDNSVWYTAHVPTDYLIYPEDRKF